MLTVSLAEVPGGAVPDAQLLFHNGSSLYSLNVSGSIGSSDDDNINNYQTFNNGNSNNNNNNDNNNEQQPQMQLNNAGYMNIVLANAAEIPGLICALFMLDRIGRRNTVSLLFFGCALVLLGLGMSLMQENGSWESICCRMLHHGQAHDPKFHLQHHQQQQQNGQQEATDAAHSQLANEYNDETSQIYIPPNSFDMGTADWMAACSSVTCNTDTFHMLLIFLARAAALGFNQSLWIYTTESFPTSIRPSAIGLCTSFARIGGAITPYFADSLFAHSQGAAIMICAVVSAVAGVIIRFVPRETCNAPLIDAVGGES